MPMAMQLRMRLLMLPPMVLLWSMLMVRILIHQMKIIMDQIVLPIPLMMEMVEKIHIRYLLM